MASRRARRALERVPGSRFESLRRQSSRSGGGGRSTEAEEEEREEKEEEEGRVFEEGEEVEEEGLLSPLKSLTPPAAIFCEPTKLLVWCWRGGRGGRGGGEARK